jgi:hypothetical protein
VKCDFTHITFSPHALFYISYLATWSLVDIPCRSKNSGHFIFLNLKYSSNKKIIFSKSIRSTDLILFLKTFTISQLHLTRCMCIEIFNISHRSLSSTTHIFFHIAHRWGFMTATLAASLEAAQNLY